MPDTLVAPLLYSLDEALDARLVGGKAAGMSRLIRLGVPVPRGFVIPASITSRFEAVLGAAAAHRTGAGTEAAPRS